jgi:hypothetical protein
LSILETSAAGYTKWSEIVILIIILRLTVKLS